MFKSLKRMRTVVLSALLALHVAFVRPCVRARHRHRQIEGEAEQRGDVVFVPEVGVEPTRF